MNEIFLPNGKSFPKGSLELNVLRAEQAEMIRKKLYLADRFSIKNKEVQKFTDEMSNSIVSLYAENDVVLALENIPKTFIMSRKKYSIYCELVGGLPNASTIPGFFDSVGKMVVMIIDNQDDEEVAKIIQSRSFFILTFHEWMHAVGFNALSGALLNPNLPHTFQTTYVVGFSTQGPRVRNGLTLEEGVVQYFAEEAALKSEYPDIQNLGKVLPAYKAATQLVRDLIAINGQDMEKILLQSRVYPQSRQRLIDVLNRHDPTSERQNRLARRIFKLPFEAGPIEKMIQEIRSKTPDPDDKAVITTLGAWQKIRRSITNFFA